MQSVVVRRSSSTMASCSGRSFSAVGARSLAPMTLWQQPRRRLRASVPLPRAASADNGNDNNANANATDAANDAAAAAQADELRATTEKYGLEAGLLKAATAKPGESGGMSRGQQAKQLLAQYGGAYLLTSISFAAVSFACCYAAVSSGVDVRALLARFGLQASDASEKVGTFAIAYAAHKALSPVRFPPTVALTPVVAKWIGSKQQKKEEEGGAK